MSRLSPSGDGRLSHARRRFNRGERVALFVASDGKCANCGATLPAGWHADHVLPFSLGGETDVDNGQALCPACNQAKGARVEQHEDPRTAWQRRARNDFIISEKPDFLVSAPPGAGKTKFGCSCAQYRLKECGDTFIVVYAPSRNVKRAWARAMAKFGIQIDPNYVIGNGIARGMQGVCVTYQAVAQPGRAEALRKLCAQYRTFSIRDEVHHAGKNIWGAALGLASSADRRRLALSGSPFRTDGARIPGVEYDADGKSICDTPRYSIGDAVRDGVTPVTMFVSFDGRMEWMSRNGRFLASFRDELPEEEGRRRLRTSLDPSGEWLPDVLRRADDRLLTIRYGDTEADQDADPHAAGLIVCMDIPHALATATLLKKITKEEPAVVHSEDDDAQDRLEAFVNGGPRWIVSVGMVTEGVDIPRLRVLVYATHKISFLLFLQVAGRLWRARDDVYMFIPAEETLLSYAERIDQEVVNALEEDAEAGPGGDEPKAPSTNGLFHPINAKAFEGDVIVGDDRLTIIEVEEARSLARDFRSTEDPYRLAAMIRRVRGMEPSTVVTTTTVVLDRADVPAEFETKETLLRKYGPRWQAHRKLSRLLGKIGGFEDRPGLPPYALVNGRLKRIYGGSSPKDLDSGLIYGQIELMDEWVAGIVEADRRGQGAAWAAEWWEGRHDGPGLPRIS